LNAIDDFEDDDALVIKDVDLLVWEFIYVLLFPSFDANNFCIYLHVR
jgi:hypothetical protein